MATKLSGEALKRAFMQAVMQRGMPTPRTEYRFDPVRRWRFDYAFPGFRIALEVEGGVFAGGRHTRGAGYRADLEKYNSAAEANWLVFRVLPEQLLSESTLAMLHRAMERRCLYLPERESVAIARADKRLPL